MKKVFSSVREAIHIFANDPAREGRSSSVSFNNGILFSYNTAIGEHVTNANGESVLIINNKNYSVTTSKQQGFLRYAANHLNCIYIDHVGYNAQSLRPSHNGENWQGLSVADLISNYEREAAENLAKASRARKNGDSYRAAAYNGLKELKTYLEFFGIAYEAGDLSTLEADAIKADKIYREEKRKREAERKAAQAEALEAWRKGEDKRNYFEVTALRIKGDIIETSRGANIPLDHAIKAWPLLSRIIKSGETFYPQGHAIHLGHYTISRADKNQLVVGCHNIPMSEVLGIAQQLNLKGA